MNEDILKGQWNQIKGDIQAWWGELTEDDVNKVNGERLKLEGLIQEQFGISKEKAKDEVDQFFNTRQVFEGQWNQLQGSAQYLWGKLTDSDIDQVQGGLTNLAGRLQEKYGKNAKEIRDEIIDWMDNASLKQEDKNE